MSYYAIRHTPSGGYLPQTRRRTGLTHDEPTADKPPRLFTRRRDAKLALDHWLKGCLINIYKLDQHTGNERRELEYYKPDTERRAEDMFVVKVEIEEVPDTSDIPERGEEWFKQATWKMPKGEETHIDEKGTTWYRPTAKSYALICKALDKALDNAKYELARYKEVIANRPDYGKLWEEQANAREALEEELEQLREKLLDV